MAHQTLSLQRIHAYEIIPQRLQKTKANPKGGSFSADEGIRKELEKYLRKSKLLMQPEIAFRIDSESDTGVKDHPVRQGVMNYLFGASATSKKASMDLAKRLSKSMDDRSPYTLLMFVAYKADEDESYRRLVMWAFPKDEPFEFSQPTARRKSKSPKISSVAVRRSRRVHSTKVFKATINSCKDSSLIARLKTVGERQQTIGFRSFLIPSSCLRASQALVYWPEY